MRWTLRGHLLTRRTCGQAYQRIYCYSTEASRTNDNGIDVELEESVQIRFRVPGTSEHGRDQGRNIGSGLAPEASQQLRHFEVADRRFDRLSRERWKEGSAVPEELGQDSTGADDEHLAKLRIDGHTDEYFSNSIGNHFFDEKAL